MDVITLEGIVYERNGLHEIADDILGTVQVEKSLEPFLSQPVKILIHHSPQSVDTSRWGGGSCYLQGQGFCPATHHISPSYLFHWEKSGICVKDDWGVMNRLEVEQIPWHMINGHRCKVCVVTLQSVEEHPAVVELKRRISSLLGQI